MLSGTVSLHYCQILDDEFDSPLPPDVRIQTQLTKTDKTKFYTFYKYRLFLR